MYHLHPMAEQTKLLERAMLSSNVQITKRQDQDLMAATNDSIAFLTHHACRPIPY